MLFRRRRLRRTRNSRSNDEENRNTSKEEISASNSLVPIYKITDSQNSSFSQHMLSYTGQTVTIFTASGGQAGMGFTGILLGVNDVFIRIILIIGSPPSCSLGNSCGSTNYYYNPYGTYQGYYLPPYTVGSVADIPIKGIAAFVHNAI